MRYFLLSLLLAWPLRAAVSTVTLTDNGGASVLRSYNDSDLKAVVTVTPIAIPQGGTPSNTTTSGRTFSNVTTTTKFNQQISYTLSGAGAAGMYPTFTSSSNTGAPVSSGGLVTHVTDGSYNITVSFGRFLNFVLPLTLTTSSFTSSTFVGWATGTLPADFNSEVDSRITTAGTANTGSTGTDGFTKLGGNLSIFSAVNDAAGTYTRNTSAWTGTLDLSGTTAWQVSGGYGGGGTFGRTLTLITPTDAISAAHCGSYIGVGCVYHFVDPSNNVYTATIASQAFLSGTDIAIDHLTWSGSTPTTLKVYPLLPANYQHTCPDYNLDYFPVVQTNQFRQVFVQDAAVNAFTSGTAYGFTGMVFNHAPATETGRAPYTITIITGDSSCPVFAAVNGALVLLGTNYSATLHASLADNAGAINTALSSLGSSYTVTTVSLSGFSTY